MRIVLVGPGRAGMSLGYAFRESGHDLVGVLGRDSAAEAAGLLGTGALSWDELVPAAELVVVGVADDAIAGVADRLAPQMIGVEAAVHISGSVSVSALDPIAEVGLATGSFHPLQSLPTAEVGRRRLAGSWAAITASDPGLHATLHELASSLSMVPFDVADQDKQLYHAGASAAANYVVGSLALAQRLLAAAGVPWEAAAPMVAAVVDNVAELGPQAALTGPIARGDVATVRAQREAVRAAVPELEPDFSAIGRAVAHLAGRESEFEGVLA
ncbi:MAG: DUF2520 domain-containing protein [Acidimicrobiia bacterium]|nr:DUF2520 domain-containing protein [Acidimicrobiia bacterium]